MSQPKSKVVLFVAVVFQTLIAAALVSMLLPYYIWGPAPTEGLAMETYSGNAEGIVRLVAVIWAGVVCVAYYTFFMRKDSGVRKQ